jgi:Holliday junction DNA helicase RuvA
VLESIKGIGKKSAERLIVELKDKFGKQALENPLGGLAVQSVDNDAITALVALGIGRPMAEMAIRKVTQTTPNIALEEIIKQALKNL